MSEDRPTLMFRPTGGIADQELAALRAKLEQAEAERDEARAAAYGQQRERLKGEDVLIGKLRAVEKERDAEHTRYVLADAGWKEMQRQRDALIAAIQRGYCPDPECGYGQVLVDDNNLSGYQQMHSPDCRVAPLLGEK